ncbi:nitroreductase family protein [Candidatus Bipolaricaulota bacterium]|nr:nitroreductase family protein [Candidatus Bipolaricaulota bacterium]
MSLYEAIFHRRSIRKYPESSLSEEKLSGVRELLTERPRLYPNISSDVVLVENGSNLQRKFSGIISDYGKVRAPHYLIVSSNEEDGHLADIGYSLEYVVLHLTSMGIGTCWIGKGFKDEELEDLVELPTAQESRALIAFGPPPDQELTRIKEPHRKGLGHFLLEKREDQLDEKERKLVDGLRRAPSAINGQPWRISIEEETVHLFIELRSKITRTLIGNMMTMNKIDGGIGLSHLEITAGNLWDDISIQSDHEVDMDGFKYIGSLNIL